VRLAGSATIFSYTVSRHTFVPWQPALHVLAIVELIEDRDVQLTTRIVDIPRDDVRIGLPVSVIFERHGAVRLPCLALVENCTRGAKNDGSVPGMHRTSGPHIRRWQVAGRTAPRALRSRPHRRGL
jgi:hypothetical protein